MLIAVGITLAILAIRSHFKAIDRERRVTLQDGTQIELLGTAVGGSIFTTEKNWQRLARRYLPARFLNWLPPAVSGACSFGPNSITVYLRVTNPPSITTSAVRTHEYAAEDDAGFLYQREGGYCSLGPTPTQTLYGFALNTYPRRQKSFCSSSSTRIM